MNYELKRIIIMLFLKILNVSVSFVYGTFFKTCNTLKSLLLELNNKSEMIYTSFKINLWPLILRIVWSGPLLQFWEEVCSRLLMSVSLLSRDRGSPGVMKPKVCA